MNAPETGTIWRDWVLSNHMQSRWELQAGSPVQEGEGVRALAWTRVEAVQMEKRRWNQRVYEVESERLGDVGRGRGR